MTPSWIALLGGCPSSEITSNEQRPRSMLSTNEQRPRARSGSVWEGHDLPGWGVCAVLHKKGQLPPCAEQCPIQTKPNHARPLSSSSPVLSQILASKCFNSCRHVFMITTPELKGSAPCQLYVRTRVWFNAGVWLAISEHSGALVLCVFQHVRALGRLRVLTPWRLRV